MMAPTFLTGLCYMLLAFCFFTSSLQHPVDSKNFNMTTEGFDDISKRSTTYVQYSGPASNFPCISEFSEWQHLRELNLPTLSSGANTESDVANIMAAINHCSRKHHVDRRIILGMIIQESRGDVGVITTYNPYATAGLMQCMNCPGFVGQHGLTLDDITGMICGGVKHFKGNLEHFGDKESRDSVWPALREYNSGNANLADLSDPRGATASYVSDVANRVMGWCN